MNEAQYQRQIQKVIESIHGYAIKTNIGEFDVAGTPDILACIDGQFIAIEAKAGSTISLKQAYELSRWRQAGAFAVVADAGQHPIEQIRLFFLETEWYNMWPNEQQEIFDGYCIKSRG